MLKQFMFAKLATLLCSHPSYVINHRERLGPCMSFYHRMIVEVTVFLEPYSLEKGSRLLKAEELCLVYEHNKSERYIFIGVRKSFQCIVH